jgi:hypothetical protein
VITVTGQLAAGATYQPNTSYTLNVRSNVPWKIEITAGSGTVILPLTADELAVRDISPTANVPVTFTTGSTEGTLGTLRVSSAEAALPAVEVPVTLKEELPNSYIVPTTGTTFPIPVRKAYSAWAADEDLNTTPAPLAGTRTVDLLWQDEQGLITDVTIAGAGENATITVTKTAGKSGNAVIVLKDNDVIRWSWHLWVTDYDPDAPLNQVQNPMAPEIILMDRHLGATTTTPGDAKSFGLFYQWGRKDPFPGAATTSATVYNSKPIYNKNNVQLTELTGTTGTGVKHQATAVPRNLLNAIENPLTFYWGAPSPTTTPVQQDYVYNWYTNNTERNMTDKRDNFWGPAYKGIFDPCPRGWRVPVTASRVVYRVVYDLNNCTIGQGIMTAIGYFPFPGIRNTTGGYFLDVGTRTVLWGATMAGGNGVMINMTSTGLSESVFQPAYGLSIRCVKVQ